MKVKIERQLQPGDRFKWAVPAVEIIDNGVYKNTRKGTLQIIEVVVLEVYPHLVRCRNLEFPYQVICVNNQQLFQKGIYNPEDFEHPFYVKGGEAVVE